MTESARTNAQAYVRRAKVVSIGAWLFLGIVVLVSGFWSVDQLIAVQNSQSVVAQAEADREEALDRLAEAVNVSEDAQRDLDRATLTQQAMLAAFNSASAEAGRLFDAKVEQLARQGAIARNPYSGLGIPPRDLIDEMAEATTSAEADLLSAGASLEVANASFESARASVKQVQSIADSSAAVVAMSERSLALELDQLALRAWVSVGLAMVALAAAAAFSIAAARARATVAPETMVVEAF